MEKQIILGAKAEQILKRLLAEGKVKSANEAIETGLSLLEQHEDKIAALREALIEGEQSGIAEDYSLDALLDKLNRYTNRNYSYLT